MFKYSLLRIIDIGTKLIITGFVAIVVILATAVSLTRYYLPLLEDYKMEVLSLVNDRVDSFHIDADRITASLHDFLPELVLYNVSLEAVDHDERIQVSEIRLSLDIIRTLREQRPFIEKLYLSNLDLYLVQSQARLWGVKTVANQSTSEPIKVRRVVDQLWAVKELQIDNIHITLDAYDQPPAKLPTASILLLSQGANKRLSAKLNQGEVSSYSNSAKLSGDELAYIHGETLFSPYDANFELNLELVAKNLRLLDYLPALSSQFGLHDIDLTTDLKFHYEKGELELQGDIAIAQLHYQLEKAGIEQLRIERLDTQVVAQFRPEQQLLAMDDFKLQVNSEGEIFSLDSLSLKHNAEHVQLFLASLDLQAAATLLSDLLLEPGIAGDDDHHEKVGAKPKTKTVKVRPALSKLSDTISGLSLQGNLEQLHFLAPRENLKDFSLSAQANSLSAQAYLGVPQLNNVTGDLFLNSTQGVFNLDAQQFHLGLLKVFDQGFSVNQAEGRLSWYLYDELIVDESKGATKVDRVGRIDDSEAGNDKADNSVVSLSSVKRLRLNGERLRLNGELGHLRGEMVLDIPFLRFDQQSQFSPPRLSLIVAAENTHAKYRHLFLPKTLDVGLKTWINTRIQSAKVNRLDYIYQGVISSNATEMRTNQLSFSLQEGKLTYLDAWPQVDDIQADFSMDDRKIDITLLKARSAGVDLGRGEVQIQPNVKTKRDDDLLLSTQINFNASVSAAYDFLSLPVLAEPMNNLIHDWQLQGAQAITGELGFDMPLAKAESSLSNNPKAPKLDLVVKAKLDSVKAIMPKLDLAFENISGDISYSLHQGLSATKLTFSLWDKPFSMYAKTSVANGKPYNTNLYFNGSIAAPSFSRWTKQAIFDLTEGVTPISGRVYFGQKGAGLALQSHLQGLTINMPEPFAKPANTEKLMRLDLPFSIAPSVLDLHLEPGINIKLRSAKSGGYDAGLVHLGIHHADFETNKLKVGGHLIKADVEQWLSFVDSFTSAQKGVNRSNRSVASRQASDWLIAVDNVLVRELVGYKQRLTAASINVLSKHNGDWLLDLDQSMVKAKLLIPHDNPIFDLDVRYLDLSFLDNANDLEQLAQSDESSPQTDIEQGMGIIQGEEFEPVLSSPELADMPAINVAIAQLMYQGEDYGYWRFQFKPSATSLTLDNLHGKLKHTRVLANADGVSKLHWDIYQGNTGKPVKTYYSGRLEGENMADVLSAWGYSQNVQSRNFNAEIQASWQGEPGDYAFAKLDGVVDFALNKGSFVDMKSSSSNALKVLSVINLSNLLRRLKLDFSDLTDEGLSYDSATGHIRLAQGVVYMEAPALEIKSAASQINIVGKADTNTEQLDLDFSVTLPLASNLPWIAALAAGLPTAAGVYVISKLLKKQVDKLSSALYKVSGDFENPEVKFIRLFDKN